MNIMTRFKELREAVVSVTPNHSANSGAVSQAAAMLVLADVIQGTTHSVDLTFDGGNDRMKVEVGGDERYPIQVKVGDRYG